MSMKWRALAGLAFGVTALALGLSASSGAAAAGPTLHSPILFVTQVPIRNDFTTITSAFGNHRAVLDSVGRGGDLWIRFPDGALKNLTDAAGYGGTGLVTGNAAIAVRDPSIHWSGSKAVFSMVVGGPSRQFQSGDYFWQLYEITGFLAAADTVRITKVPNQPGNANNVSPIYGTDDRIIFTSDRPRDGSAMLYPQLDEYEEAPTNTGLWSLDPVSGNLRLLNHAPSGDFTPIIDSFGRVVFTQWDHLQRDQQSDTDASSASPQYGTFNYASETSNAYDVKDRSEVFPEPRPGRRDLLAGTDDVGQLFNNFLPWTTTEDGRESEILNHLGRHDLGVYINRSLKSDANLVEFYRQYANRGNYKAIGTGIFQIKESPAVGSPGTELEFAL